MALVAPLITAAGWLTTPVGSGGTIAVYTDTPIESGDFIEFSLDAGTTWFDHADGPQTLPTVGGSITAGSSSGGASAFVITVVDTTTVGTVEVLVRVTNDKGTSPVEAVRVRVFDAAVLSAGVIVQLPQAAGTVGHIAEAPDGGFAVLCYPQVAPSGNQIDFGNGVVQSGVVAQSLVVVVYDMFGIAQRSVMVRHSSTTAPQAPSISMAASGAGLVVTLRQATANGTLQYRRHTEAANTTYNSRSAVGFVVSFDPDTLLPQWSWSISSGVRAGGAVCTDSRVFVNSGPAIYSSSTTQYTSAWQALLPNFNITWQLDAATGAPLRCFWQTATTFGAPIGPTDPAALDPVRYASYGSLQWFAGAGYILHRRGPDGYQTWGTDRGSIATNYMATLIDSDDAITHMWVQPVTGSGRPFALQPTAVAADLSGETPRWQFAVTADGNTGKGRWGDEEYTIDASDHTVRGYLHTTASGETALTYEMLGADGEMSTPRFAATCAESALFVANLRAIDVDDLSLEVESPDGARVDVVTADGWQGSATVIHTGESGLIVVRGICRGPGGVSAWFLGAASNPLDPAPAPVELAPSNGATFTTASNVGNLFVAAISQAGVWAEDLVDDTPTPDPSNPVAPTDPAGEWESPVPEGASWSAVMNSGDPNAEVIDHPDPVVQLLIRTWNSLTGVWVFDAEVEIKDPADPDKTLYAITVENSGAGQVSVSVNPHSDFDGAVTWRFQAVSVHESGALTASGIVERTVDWLSEPDPPSIETAEFPDTWEDTPVVGVFKGSDPDTGDTHTWRLSPQTDEPYTTTSTTAVTLFDSSDPEKVAGVVQITAGQGTLEPTPVFTPALNYHGTYEGSVRIEDPVFTSDWRRFSGKVIAVPDVPGEITPGSVEVEEDSSTTREFSFTDGDVGDASYEWQVSPNGSLWLDEEAQGTDLVVRLDEDDDDEDTKVDVTLEPRANYVGTTTFWLRCRKESRGLDGDDLIQYTTRQITVVVTPKPDAPAAPLPTRMPTVVQGTTAVQTFTSVDPDAGDTATYRVRPVGGTTWSTTSVSLGAGVGTVTLEQGSTSDRTAVARFVHASGFRGRYAFELQVIDSDGLTSPVTRVQGVVGARGLYAELVRLEHTETAASLLPLGPLPMLEPSITESVTGTDGASCRVEGPVVRRLAALWETSPDELLAPWSVELHIWGDAQLQFSGPVRRREYDFDSDAYDLEVRGLAAYLEKRQLETADAVFANVEQTTIIVDLIDAEQARSYGDRLIDTSTAAATGQNRTITFPRGSSIADCISELQDQADGPEVRINADRELLVAPILGTDRRDVLVFTPAITAGLRLEEDGDSITTIAQVVGTADDENPVYGSSAADTATLERYGRICAWVEADRIGTELGADAAADRLISTHGRAGSTVTFTHVAPEDAPEGRGAWDYHAGDVCTMRVPGPRGELMAHGRIITKQLRPIAGPDGGYLIQLTVELLGEDGVVRPARAPHGPEFVEQIWDMHKFLR